MASILDRSATALITHQLPEDIVILLMLHVLKSRSRPEYYSTDNIFHNTFYTQIVSKLQYICRYIIYICEAKPYPVQNNRECFVVKENNSV